MISRWTSYRAFQFDANVADLRASEASQVSEIALYLKANPSLKVGLDGSMVPHNQDLSNDRVRTVRDALIEAGVPGSKIQAGPFDDTKVPQDGRVTVLFRTANY